MGVKEIVYGVAPDTVGFVRIDGAAVQRRESTDPRFALMGGFRDGVVVITRIHVRGQTDRAPTPGARAGVSLHFRLGESRQEHAGEDRDDGDHDEQFY